MHLTARRGNPELFNFFISKGVSANQIDTNGNIALINAAAGSKENLEKILANSNNITHQNQIGKSAITIAIERGKKENFYFLLSQRADLNIKDTLGNNLMYYVFESHNSKKKEVTQHFISQLSLRGLDGKKHMKMKTL